MLVIIQPAEDLGQANNKSFSIDLPNKNHWRSRDLPALSQHNEAYE
jgi:hypothetical protein